jgi:hypothetical protein
MTDQPHHHRTKTADVATENELLARAAKAELSHAADDPAMRPDRTSPTNKIRDARNEPEVLHGERSVKYRWPIRQITDARHGIGVVYAELSISHSVHTKAFSASLAPTTVYANGWGTTSYTLTGAYWHRRQPVHRYTAKRLETYAADALAQFRADADTHHPAILDAFEVTQ